jgi:uncharacterized repeat protein (TIGR03847 family)
MSLNLGLVSLLGADAVGQPGQRRFRLYALSASGSVVMWIEKEPLNSLSFAIDHALAEVTEGKILRIEAQVGKKEEPSEVGMPADFPYTPTSEFQVGHMSLDLFEQERFFLVNAVPLEITMSSGEEALLVLNEEAKVSFKFSLDQAQQLARSIDQVITAGRPICPFCHMPLDSKPHSCAKQNGHKKILRFESPGRM